MRLFQRSTLTAIVMVFILSMVLSVTPAHAAGIVVNDAGDSVADDGVCTLREAITAANTNAASGASIGECAAGDPAPTVDEITFAGNYTITLGSQLPAITTPLTITGNGAGDTIIQGDASCDPTPESTTSCTHDYRVLEISGAVVNLNALTIRRGRLVGIGNDYGAGLYIHNSSNVTLSGVTIQDNYTDDDGGGIYAVDSILTLDASTISENQAGLQGGGIDFDSTGTLTIENNSQIKWNTAGSHGGGINAEGDNDVIIDDSKINYNETTNSVGGGIYRRLGTLTIKNESQIYGNDALNNPDGDGGGIYCSNSTNMTIEDSTIIEYNEAYDNGGGIYVEACEATIDNSTVYDNEAAEGGGIFHDNNSSLTVRNGSVIEANEALDGKGGGIFHENGNGGSTTISYSEIFDNESDGYGAGVYGGRIEDDYFGGGTLNVDHSAIFENTAYNEEGGGIVTYGPVMTISDSVIYNNTSDEDGDAGVGAWAPTTITNTTISGNSAPNAVNGAGGLGVYETTATLYNVTITNNTGGIGGGGISDWKLTESILNVYNSIIANNNDRIAPDCYFENGTVNFNDTPSILGQITGCNNMTNTGSVLPDGTDPLLLPLADNGGPTMTHAIGTNSPAFDASGGSATTADQRGVAVYGSARDLGAFEFRVEESDPDALPATGFAPGRITRLPQQPASKAYTSSSLWMEISKLGVQIDIVGVPVVNGEWDVAWLGDNAGWLEGTAFPTYAGNTGITAHVWDANNNPGPFANLKKLQHGDVVEIHAWGYVYTYSVRYNYLTTPTNTTPLRHEEYDWVTLLTCERYSPTHDNYRFRRVVRAVLVNVRVE